MIIVSLEKRRTFAHRTCLWKRVKKSTSLYRHITLKENVRNKVADIFYMKLLVTIGLILAPTIAMPQLIEDMVESFKLKPKFTAKVGTRNSFITNSYMRIRDVSVGLNFGNTTKIGFGYNWLATDVIRPLTVADENVRNNEGELKMRYLASFIEYTFLKKEKYNFSIPVQVGIGKAFFNYRTDVTYNNRTDPVLIAFYEPSLAVEYTGIKYIGIGVGAGYRLMFAGYKKLEDNYNAPVYLFRFKVYFGDVFQEVLK